MVQADSTRILFSIYKMTLLPSLPAPPPDQTGWPWTEECRKGLYAAQNEWPKISLIIPSFNQGHYIEETIRSILHQNYPNLELIVIDGGSTDATASVLKKYSPWIDYQVSEKDNGQSHAINKGIKKISGEIVNWVNSDDYLAQNALFEIASYFVTHPDVVLIYGNSDIVYPGIETTHYEAVEFEPLDFISRISVHQPSTFWRTKLFDEVGLLDENMHFCMDYDLWARIVFNHQTRKLNKTLSGFRRYPESKSSNFEDQNNIYNEYRKVVSRFFNSMASEHVSRLKDAKVYNNPEDVKYKIPNPPSPELVKRMLDKYLYICASQEYIRSDIKKANQILKYCFNRSTFAEAVLLWVKNNLRVRRIFHPYRKAEYN